MILIDDRAGSKQLVDHSPLDKIAVLSRLASGDVLILGNGPEGDVLVGVEVKSVMDLVSSILSGRIKETQIPQMLKDYQVSWLLVYGLYKEGKKGEMLVWKAGGWAPCQIGKRVIPYKLLESFYFSLSAVGISTKEVASVKAAASWIGGLAKWWERSWESHSTFQAFDNTGQAGVKHEVSLVPSMTENERLVAHVAAQLPGIGYKRAVTVAGRFNTVREMVGASEQEWLEIPGIGKVIAREVVKAMG